MLRPGSHGCFAAVSTAATGERLCSGHFIHSFGRQCLHVRRILAFKQCQFTAVCLCRCVQLTACLVRRYGDQKALVGADSRLFFFVRTLANCQVGCVRLVVGGVSAPGGGVQQSTGTSTCGCVCRMPGSLCFLGAVVARCPVLLCMCVCQNAAGVQCFWQRCLACNRYGDVSLFARVFLSGCVCLCADPSSRFVVKEAVKVCTSTCRAVSHNAVCP